MGARVYGNHRIFGFGERIGNFWAEIGTYSIWNRAGPQVFEDGEPPGKNLYGSHPVYFMQRSKTTEFFGVYDHNSGPQDFVLEHSKDGIEMNNIKTTGKTNLFFLMNDDINNVIKNYYNLVGKPNLPPEWGFGWHQSRFGYNSTNYLREVYKGYQNKSMPLDALWSDVDLLEAFRVFTLDKDNFGDIKDVVSEMKTTGTHYVTLIGSGISAGITDAYFEGKKKGVFLKSPNEKKDPLIGRNTPGDVVFVDFFYHNSKDYWLDQLETFRKDVPFDGVWLDMNEVTSYCNGVCYIDQKAPNPIDNKLFYWPGGRDLEKGTISIDAVHENGALELDTHSLFGLLQSYDTAEYFKSKNQRPFIISRSTFAGSGKYAGHWTGDNKSDFKDLMDSVNSILLFNMFGIPFVGADVCGFSLTTSATLCAQWYKLAVIYPFARNHNELMSHGQEPYQDNMFGFVIDSRYNFTAQQIIKKAMMTRYGLHRYSYTQFHKASTEGAPPLKPLFFNYPKDQYSYEYITENFFLGDGVKVSPHITFYGRSQFYFPGTSEERWCPIWE
jgi:lysosomal alpha-glucosidase